MFCPICFCHIFCIQCVWLFGHVYTYTYTTSWRRLGSSQRCCVGGLSPKRPQFLSRHQGVPWWGELLLPAPPWEFLGEHEEMWKWIDIHIHTQIRNHVFCQTCLAPPCQVVCIRCVTMCTSERSLTSTCEATGLGDFALVAARLGWGAGHATHPITCKPSDVILFAVTCLCFVQYVFVTFSASSVCDCLVMCIHIHIRFLFIPYVNWLPDTHNCKGITVGCVAQLQHICTYVCFGLKFPMRACALISNKKISDILVKFVSWHPKP